MKRSGRVKPDESPGPGRGLAVALLACSLSMALSCGDPSESGIARTQAGPGMAVPVSSVAPPPAVTGAGGAAPEPYIDDEDVSVFVDVGCPAPPAPVELVECEPLASSSGCISGYGCYPFVIYPEAPCEPETYGSLCAPVGVGQQGDPCSNSLCADGFLCVATGRGTQCAELCRAPGKNTCPPGFLCGSVDIVGFGTCF